MDNGTIKIGDFLKTAHATAERASEVVKQAAADNEALYGIKDPTEQGKASIPGCGDASHRSSLGLPPNSNNLGEADKEHNIMSVTKPNGTGQGEYTTPRCGTSLDESIKSPTAPISKMATIAQIASNLRAAAEAGVQKEAAAPAETQETQAPAAAEAPAAPQEKAAAPAVQLPTEFANDADLMSKLASIAAVALGSEEGRRAFADILEKEAGVKEACALVSQAANSIQEAAQAQTKQASSGLSYADFQVAEMCKQAHATWLGSFETELEKKAYAQGVEDANAVADAVDAGAEPTIPGAGEGLEDDQVLQILQELVTSGEVSQEEADAILAAAGNAAADGLDPEELAAALQQTVEAGQISPDQAAAIAQVVMGGAGAEGAPAEAVPAGAEDQAAAAAAEDPTVKAAASQAIEKAASVAGYLWGIK